MKLLSLTILPLLLSTRSTSISVSSNYFCFYENDNLEEIYGASNERQIDRVITSSGIDWVISESAYGEDEPTHQSLNYKGIYTSHIWNSTYNLTNLDSETSPFRDSEYLYDYKALISPTTLGIAWSPSHFSVVMSKDYLEPNSVDDISIFLKYSTGSQLGAKIMVKPENKDWTYLYYSGYNDFTGATIGTVDSPQTKESEKVIIDGSQFDRIFDSYFVYDDATYRNFSTICGENRFKLAVVFMSANDTGFDYILDGILVNKKINATNYINGLKDKNICKDGLINDKNTAKSLKLLDKVLTSEDINYLMKQSYDESRSVYDIYSYLLKIVSADKSNNIRNFIFTKDNNFIFLVSSIGVIAITSLSYFIYKRRKLRSR